MATISAVSVGSGSRENFKVFTFISYIWAALGCSATPRQPVVRVR